MNSTLLDRKTSGASDREAGGDGGTGFPRACIVFEVAGKGNGHAAKKNAPQRERELLSSGPVWVRHFARILAKADPILPKGCLEGVFDVMVVG